MSEMCDLMEELMNERAEERVKEEKVELAKKSNLQEQTFT
jgi:hypothetical protein